MGQSPTHLLLWCWELLRIRLLKLQKEGKREKKIKTRRVRQPYTPLLTCFRSAPLALPNRAAKGQVSSLPSALQSPRSLKYSSWWERLGLSTDPPCGQQGWLQLREGQCLALAAAQQGPLQSPRHLPLSWEVSLLVSSPVLWSKVLQGLGLFLPPEKGSCSLS